MIKKIERGWWVRSSAKICPGCGGHMYYVSYEKHDGVIRMCRNSLCKWYGVQLLFSRHDR